MAAVMGGAMKPLRWPGFWFGLWVLAMVVVMTTCLLPGKDIPEVPAGMDKVEHFTAFFVLSVSAVQLFATRRALLRAAAWLVILGILIEFAQGAFTVDRTPDPFDALADTIGVLLGLCIAKTPLGNLLLRMFPRRMP